MEDILKQILLELKDIKKDVQNTNQKLDSFEKQTNVRFNNIDKKLNIIQDVVADLCEFRTEVKDKKII